MKLKLLIAIYYVTLSVFANASTTDDFALIESPHFMANGSVIFYHSATRVGTIPNCASAQTGRWVVDGTTEGGRVQVSGLLSAYALKLKVRILGHGSCGPWSNTETVDYLVFGDK